MEIKALDIRVIRPGLPLSEEEGTMISECVSKRQGYLMTFGPQKKSSKILEYLMNLFDHRRNKIKRYMYNGATEKYTEVDAYGFPISLSKPNRNWRKLWQK
jgi:hypothetical protein